MISSVNSKKLNSSVSKCSRFHLFGVSRCTQAVGCTFMSIDAMLTLVFCHLGPRPPSFADENSNVLLMQDWLNNCRLNHVTCNDVTKDFIPTRLLDLEAFNGSSPTFEDDIKLVCLNSNKFGRNELPPYITLSHCWGPPEKRPVTTTQTNLTAKMAKIPFGDLPRTFRDAVVVTRKLGQRYLWIDSLCIIRLFVHQIVLKDCECLVSHGRRKPLLLISAQTMATADRSICDYLSPGESYGIPSTMALC